MRTSALISAVLTPPLLLALGSGPAAPSVPEPSATGAAGETAALAAMSKARTGFVRVERASTDARLTANVHVDPPLQRLGVSLSFSRGTPDTWGLVWIGKRDGHGGCTHEIKVQGRTARIASWTVRGASGTPIPIARDYSPPGANALLLELDRSNLPDACAVAELWTGDQDGPTRLLTTGERRITRAIADGSIFTQFPVRFRLRWGQDSPTEVEISSSVSGPSVVSGLSVGLGPVSSQGSVVDAASAPMDWDFWADGLGTTVNMPARPTQPWGTRVRPRLTTDDGSWLRLARRLKVIHRPPGDWEGSLAGLAFWDRHTTQPWLFRRMTFLDDTWVYLQENGAVIPKCTTSSPRWGRGCHRYWYDAGTGRLQIGQLQARVTDDGWWWQGDGYDRAYRVRTLAPGQTRFYRGRGQSVACCSSPRVKVWLWRNGRYLVVRGKEAERGHYRALARGTIRLDPGARGGRTRKVTLSFFGRLVDGTWETREVRFADTRTRPF